MTLQEEFYKDLHDGNTIDGMVRFNECYKREINGVTEIRFNNGNTYVIENGVILKKYNKDKC